MTKVKDYEKNDLYICQWLIEKLKYLLYDTKPDILFVIRLFNKHKIDFKKDYIQVLKDIIWYLKKIIALGLIYNKKLINKITSFFLVE